MEKQPNNDKQIVAKGIISSYLIQSLMNHLGLDPNNDSLSWKEIAERFSNTMQEAQEASQRLEKTQDQTKVSSGLLKEKAQVTKENLSVKEIKPTDRRKVERALGEQKPKH